LLRPAILAHLTIEIVDQTHAIHFERLNIVRNDIVNLAQSHKREVPLPRYLLTKLDITAGYTFTTQIASTSNGKDSSLELYGDFSFRYLSKSFRYFNIHGGPGIFR
jgi:hypothetical protein